MTKSLGVPITIDDALSFGMDKLFSGIPSRDRIKFIEDIFLAAVKINNDEMALGWVEMYENESRKLYSEDENFMVKSFPQWLMGLYLQIPVSRPILFGVIPTVLKTKDWMLKRIIVGWMPELNNLSASIFDFLMKEQRRILATFSGVFKEPIECIPRIIREHTDSKFTPEQLEQWIERGSLINIPDNILQVLAKAWVRNGGWKKLPELLKAGSPQQK